MSRLLMIAELQKIAASITCVQHCRLEEESSRDFVLHFHKVKRQVLFLKNRCGSGRDVLTFSP